MSKDRSKVKSGKSKVNDPLKCPKCGKVAQSRRPSPDGEYLIWNHLINELGKMRRITICTIKKEDYEWI